MSKEDLERRRYRARSTLEYLAAEAEREGCDLLSLRLRRLSWNVGVPMVTPTPPALAERLKERLPRLIKAAQADPKKHFFELQPLRRRKKPRNKPPKAR